MAKLIIEEWDQLKGLHGKTGTIGLGKAGHNFLQGQTAKIQHWHLAGIHEFW